MGTQPEEIEQALKGKRTLPQPGEPRKLEEDEKRKTASGQSREQGQRTKHEVSGSQRQEDS